MPLAQDLLKILFSLSSCARPNKIFLPTFLLLTLIEVINYKSAEYAVSSSDTYASYTSHIISSETNNESTEITLIPYLCLLEHKHPRIFSLSMNDTLLFFSPNNISPSVTDNSKLNQLIPHFRNKRLTGASVAARHNKVHCESVAARLVIITLGV
jgi:hypothetical protein